jgi:hypothetical protein
VGHEAGRHPALDHGFDGLGLGEPCRGRVDHGPHRRARDALYDRRRIGHGIDEIGFARGERLDAVGDPGGDRVRRNGRPSLDRPFRRSCRICGVEPTLGGRAVHEVRAAKVDAQLDQASHHVDGALPSCPIGGGDGEVFGRDKQPVQPTHRDPVVRRGLPDRGALPARHPIGFIPERERGNFEPLVPELRGESALAHERQIPDDFVTESQPFHASSKILEQRPRP